MDRMPTREQILEALRVVVDPELRQDIVTLGMVRSIKVSDGGVVDVTVSLTTPGCPIRSHFQTSVASATRGVEGVTAVSSRVEETVQVGVAAGERFATRAKGVIA